MQCPAPGRLHVGCAGWSIPRTAAARFPANGSHLQRYAQALTAVEINTSFYRPHRPQTYERWAQAVPADFRFAVKMPKQVTHTLRLRDTHEAVDGFLGQCAHLGEKLGPLLVQLPPALSFDAAATRRFWQELRDGFNGSVVCEPRHPSWFTEEAEAMLADYCVARVAADPAVVPSAASPAGHTALAYFRLHGSPRMYYSAYERAMLETLADRLAGLLQAGAEVWCVFDNTAEGAAMSDALAVRDLLTTMLAIRP
jgi:uncharacterized protein YecE (DUF72 family)